MSTLQKWPVTDYCREETPVACCPECYPRVCVAPRVWQPLTNQYYYDPLCKSEWAMTERIPFSQRRSTISFSDKLVGSARLVVIFGILVGIVALVGRSILIHHGTEHGMLWLVICVAIVTWGCAAVIIDHFVYTPLVSGIEWSLRFILNTPKQT
jgi:hypothetical protein